MSYGFDTIKVGFPVAPTDIDRNGWRHRFVSEVKEQSEDVIGDCYTTQFRTANGTHLFLKYIPADYKGNVFNMLFIEFSLPKLVFGCNHRDLEDWKYAFDLANAELRTIASLPSLPDICTALLYRIDLCTNLQVGEENVGDYMQALHKGHHPHRKTEPWGENGVVFASQRVSTCIYDKQRECGHEEAKGILRYEIQMRSKWSIADWTGKECPTLSDITPEMIKDLIAKDMRILHLDTHMVCDRLTAETILSKIYTTRQTQNLLGYLVRRGSMTVEQMKQAGCTPQSRYRYEKMLAKAGISSLSLESRKTLSALTLLLETDDNIKNYHKVPSDTRTLPLGDVEQGGLGEQKASLGHELSPEARSWLDGHTNFTSGKGTETVLRDIPPPVHSIPVAVSSESDTPEDVLPSFEFANPS